MVLPLTDPIVSSSKDTANFLLTIVAMLELNDKVSKLALAHHTPSSPDKQPRLADILRGKTPNGESLVGADLSVEVFQGSVSLNDKRKTKTFTVPLS
jgi:hypothetical protein